MDEKYWDRIFEEFSAEVGRSPKRLPSVSIVASQVHSDPYAVLVSTILSLRTKDEVTLAASKRLLEIAPDIRSLDALDEETIQSAIYPAGFYKRKAGQLKDKKKEDALRHPNWNMGAKITIDSATLMNKGLELIEAVWLFGLPPEKIQIVVQRQSIIHSAVQFSDHSILAQMGVPDMRIPIQYALTWPRRGGPAAPELDFAALKVLTFDVADEETFRCLAACKKAIAKGGLGPCAANGANEEAVKLFLEDKIGFLDIGRLVEAVVDSDRFGGSYTLADVYECDRMARAFVHAAL